MTKKNTEGKIINYKIPLKAEDIKAYFRKPFTSSLGMCYIEGGNMHTPNDVMRFWRFRRPNDIEVQKLSLYLMDTAFESQNIGVICRTPAEVRIIKNSIKRFYHLKDVDDRTLVGLPMRVIFGEFIDEDELFDEIIIDTSKKKYATLVPTKPTGEAVEFPDLICDDDAKRIAIDLRTPILVHDQKLTLV